MLRFLLSAALGIAVACAQTGNASTAGAQVEGAVVSLNGAPVPNASVTLAAISSGDQPRVSSSTVRSTDDRGVFVFEGLAPGRYALMAQAQGFVRQAYGSGGKVGGILEIAAGQRVTGIDFKLTPNGAISGRVIDNEGKPLDHVLVMLMRVSYLDGSRRLSPEGSAQIFTDAEGRYRVSDIPSGRYYVSAALLQNAKPGEERSATARETVVPAFYPGASDLRAAVPVMVSGGSESGGIDIRMRKEPVHSIRGKAFETLGGKPAPHASLTLRPGKDAVPSMSNNTSATTKDDGTFEFERVPPGEYTISGANSGNHLSGRVPVNVSRDDVDNVVVGMGPGAQISGSIRLEDGTALTDSPAVTLDPEQFFLGVQTSSGSSKLAFDGVQPAKYSVRVIGLDSDLYVKSMRFGGQDVAHGSIDLSSGGGTLDIVLSAKSGSVTGVAKNRDGVVVPGAFAALWPKISSLDVLPKGVPCDASGAFRFGSLPPGEYYVVAWEEAPPDGIASYPEFLARFTTDAATVKLEEGYHESVEVKAIPRDRIAAEYSNVP